MVNTEENNIEEKINHNISEEEDEKIDEVMEEDVEEPIEEAPQDDLDHASATEKPKSADSRSSTHATASMVVRNEDASNGGWGSIVALTAVVVLAALAIHRALKRR